MPLFIHPGADKAYSRKLKGPAGIERSQGPYRGLRPLLCVASLALSGLIAFFEDEDDFQVRFVAGDVAILDQDIHVLDMSALDVTKSAGGAVVGLVNRIFEALL